MRSKKAFFNVIFAFVQELIAVICAFILPRLIMSGYGSQYNGITSSITQFLGFAVIFRAGIGGATRVALYKPLANNDINAVSSIMVATKKYMNKITLMIVVSFGLFACIYPFFVLNEFDWFFSFSLFIVIGISTIFENLFGITNLILLQADQKLYISSIARIVSTVINTVITVILVKRGSTIHVVKLGSALAFCIYPIIMYLYVKKKYKIDYTVQANESAISQKWDVFFHQIANFVMTNTDVVVLSIFVPMAEVSVYSVYALVANGLRKLVLNFTYGIEGAFGNIYALGQKKQFESNFKFVEFFIFSVATIVYSCTYILILDFIALYTKGITDINYLRPVFSLLLILSQFFMCVRQPYQIVVQAAGHYKQTRNGAILEPIINIVISVICVIKFGLVGVMIGTLAAMLFRTVQYSIYVDRKLISGTFISMIKRLIISIVEALLIILICNQIPLNNYVSSYGQWILKAFITVIISVLVVCLFSIILNRKEVNDFCEKMKKILMRKSKKGELK